MILRCFEYSKVQNCFITFGILHYLVLC